MYRRSADRGHSSVTTVLPSLMFNAMRWSWTYFFCRCFRVPLNIFGLNLFLFASKWLCALCCGSLCVYMCPLFHLVQGSAFHFQCMYAPPHSVKKCVVLNSHCRIPLTWMFIALILKSWTVPLVSFTRS